MIWLARFLLFAPFARSGLDVGLRLGWRPEVAGAYGLLLGVACIWALEFIAKHHRAKDPTP